MSIIGEIDCVFFVPPYGKREQLKQQLTKFSLQTIILSKAMTERDEGLRPQRAGGWCKPAAEVFSSYGSRAGCSRVLPLGHPAYAA